MFCDATQHIANFISHGSMKKYKTYKRKENYVMHIDNKQEHSTCQLSINETDRQQLSQINKHM